MTQATSARVRAWRWLAAGAVAIAVGGAVAVGGLRQWDAAQRDTQALRHQHQQAQALRAQFSLREEAAKLAAQARELVDRGAMRPDAWIEQRVSRPPALMTRAQALQALQPLGVDQGQWFVVEAFDLGVEDAAQSLLHPPAEQDRVRVGYAGSLYIGVQP